MSEFDQILDDCLEKLTSGASTLDECLVRHPEHAAQLRPFLQVAGRFEQGRGLRPSPAFKSRTRRQLYTHMQTHPQSNKANFPFFWRVAISFLVLVFAFISTGTAYAQNALPGDTFYNWKLTSEHIWRAVSKDPVSTDLAVADRRVNEWNLVSEDPARSAKALDGYREALNKLESEVDSENQSRILSILQAHQEKFKKAGLSVPELDQYLPVEIDSNSTNQSPEVAPTQAPVPEGNTAPFSTDPPKPDPNGGKTPPLHP